MKYTASFLNLFNHPHFEDPSPYFDSSTYGQLLYAYGPISISSPINRAIEKSRWGLSVNF